MDPQSKRLVATLRGHQDYSFACAWSPNGNIIATGNQDKSTRLYDIRNTSTTLKVLVSELASPRSLRYSSDGKMLAVTEEGEFCSIAIMPIEWFCKPILSMCMIVMQITNKSKLSTSLERFLAFLSHPMALPCLLASRTFISRPT